MSLFLLFFADFLLLTICVGFCDYLLFYKASFCPRCGYKPNIFGWIPATFLELLLFVVGIYFGYFILR